MLVSQLEDTMRKAIRQRITAGVLTGTVLARQTGFQQAHISNFLNGRRGLSVEGFDRMLEALEPYFRMNEEQGQTYSRSGKRKPPSTFSLTAV